MTQNKWPLPVEITERIVELLCWDRRYSHFIYDNVPGTAQYAGVCREWRDLVERRTFRILRLTRARLADVERIVCQRRRAYLRIVDLDVELEPHERGQYGEFETAEENERNSALFSETMQLFFDFLSRWAPGGLSLCITACSPSDVSPPLDLSWDMDLDTILEDRHIRCIQMLPAELPVVENVSKLIWTKGRHISAPAWTVIINSLPNAKKIKIGFWDNEKYDLVLRKRQRDEIGNALAQMRCPNAEVSLSCSYESPKDHSSIPPTLNARGTDNAFARGLRTWMRQLKALQLSEALLAPEMFYPAASDDKEAASEWPYLERLDIYYAGVTPHGTWLLNRNPEDPPLGRPPPVVDLDDWSQLTWGSKILAPEDMYEDSFRTVPVAEEMDRIHRSAARAARRMPALRELYLFIVDQAIEWGPKRHAFLYRYNADRRVATAHWGSFPGYTPAEDVVELWRELVYEVRGCQLEVLINEDEC
ncbi:hypothetical protein HDV64DRAFT_271029 [Trichoderma sp. TUCIM 5745]